MASAFSICAIIDSRHSLIGSIFITGGFIFGRFFTDIKSSSSSSFISIRVFFFGEISFVVGGMIFSFDELNKMRLF